MQLKENYTRLFKYYKKKRTRRTCQNLKKLNIGCHNNDLNPLKLSANSSGIRDASFMINFLLELYVKLFLKILNKMFGAPLSAKVFIGSIKHLITLKVQGNPREGPMAPSCTPQMAPLNS